MICRVCPKCGGEWFSADTGSWPCAYCGAMLDEKDERHNRLSRLEVETDVGNELLRQKQEL